MKKISDTNCQHDRARLTPSFAKERLIVILFVILAYAFLNFFVRLHLPGVSNVDIRPQIVLVFAAGFLYGPWWGFLAGFAGNFLTDQLFGYGLTYVLSWTIGNGLIGALPGFFPFRMPHQIDRISRLVALVLSVVLINLLALVYAAGMESLSGSRLATTINFYYFFLPALLSNSLEILILLPVLLLFYKRFRLNYPIKFALSNYYLTIVILCLSWIVFSGQLQILINNLDGFQTNLNHGNAFVDIFNYWSLLMVVLLLVGFFISSWLSRSVVGPIKQLEEAVYAVLRGDNSLSEPLHRLMKRQDEVGILSHTIRLLSEKLLETQQLFQKEIEKKMSLLEENDSVSDFFIVALISMFGKETVESRESESVFSRTGEITAREAIDLLVSSCGLRELATTYSESKLQKSFEDFDQHLFDCTNSTVSRQSLALAIDLNLIFKGRLLVTDLGAPLEKNFAYHLLEKAQVFQKSEKSYMGYLTQPDIISHLESAWQKTPVVRNEQLESVMNLAINQKVISGYQIKPIDGLARFDENLRIAYSHSSLKHIKQLVGLLVSENIQAKIQLEAKCSSFIYLDEWEKTDDLYLESLSDSRKIAHKQEFDLVLEFSTDSYRDRFKTVIETFARKENTSQNKLLFESWFQPLYCSNRPVKGYFKIFSLTFHDQQHVVSVYSLEKQSEKVRVWLGQEAGDFQPSVAELWVNEAFYQYLEDVFQ